MSQPQPEAPAVYLHFGPQTLGVAWQDAQGDMQRRTLPLGLQPLARAHRFTRPPTALALESAIESIEEAVMPLAPAMPEHATLMLQDGNAPQGLRQALGGRSFDLEGVEAAFDRLTHLALGRPAALAGVPDDPDFALGLLIVREAMHHLRLQRGAWLAPG